MMMMKMKVMMVKSVIMSEKMKMKEKRKERIATLTMPTKTMTMAKTMTTKTMVKWLVLLPVLPLALVKQGLHVSSSIGGLDYSALLSVAHLFPSVATAPGIVYVHLLRLPSFSLLFSLDAERQSLFAHPLSF